ncbi:MAG: fibronectin type III domain-containing protein [Bacteroidales bacterium]|nr:fibronectin type III domain-containing protein [Bacteroidales bacterium]
MKLNRFFLSLGLVAAVAACGPKDNPVNPSGGDDTPAVNPSAPTGLRVHKAEETSLQFQWDDMKGATSYDYTLTLDGTLLQEGNVKTRNVTVSGLTKATTYTFTVYSLAKDFKSSGSSVPAKTAGTEDPAPGPVSIAYEDFGIPAAEEDGVARAFPGAEGGGMYVTGGRGGKVYHVTKLADDGSEGTLRYGIEKESRPLVIVFDVAGVIPLAKALKIQNGNLTIAGQTAPGDGICLKNYNFRIAVSNVILRFMRFRMGDEAKTEDDALNLYTGDNNIQDVIIDHCSLSWSTDECGSFYGMTNFSLQWCILSESLRNSIHEKGKHGYGGIWGGANATYHHNLLAHHDSRNPRIDHDYVSTLKGPVSLINNVIYNWGDNSCYGGESKPGSDFKKYNIVNNYYKPGPATASGKVRFLDPTTNCKNCDSAHPDQVVPGHFYMSGNTMDGNDGYTADNWSGKATTASAGLIATIKADTFFRYEKESALSLHNAQDAFDKVVGFAGASLKRDAVDERVTRETKDGIFTFNGSNGSGKGFIDTQSDVGGWPSYTGTQVTDTDGDGIPDSVEDEWGLNKNIAADGEAVTLDKNGRYTNLEMYLHFLVKDVVSGGNAGGDYTKL